MVKFLHHLPSHLAVLDYVLLCTAQSNDFSPRVRLFITEIVEKMLMLLRWRAVQGESQSIFLFSHIQSLELSITAADIDNNNNNNVMFNNLTYM
jgi:hypothetical protein